MPPTQPLPLGDCVASPFMVRQAHHERTTRPLEINYLAVRPEPVEGRKANYDTVSR